MPGDKCMIRLRWCSDHGVDPGSFTSAKEEMFYQLFEYLFLFVC